MSLGVSVDITLAAAQSADLVIAQVNPRMPRVMGQSFIHSNYVHYVVEHEEDLLSVEPTKEVSEAANEIGVRSKLIIIKDAPHSFHLQPKQKDLRPEVIDFFDKHLKP